MRVLHGTRGASVRAGRKRVICQAALNRVRPVPCIASDLRVCSCDRTRTYNLPGLEQAFGTVRPNAFPQVRIREAFERTRADTPGLNCVAVSVAVKIGH